MLSIPSNFYVQTANGVNLVSWDLTAGADTYTVQRSLDNITYSTIASVTGSPLATSYLDTAVTQGTQYWYQVSASGNLGTSLFTTAQSVVPVKQGEMCLSQIRLASQQKADRVNSNFVGLPEINQYINRSMYELYDLLVTVYEDYYMSQPIQFVSDGVTFMYPLPNGTNTFLNGLNPAQTITPRPYYKLLGVDLALNNAVNAFVTVNKFNFIDRNRFVYPNTASTIYGVFNLQYRVMDDNIMFIPTPTAGQALRLWYIPRLELLLQDTDVTVAGINGWIEYVITRTAKYILDKEESDTTKLDAEILFLKARIEETAANRDAGLPDKISDSRQGNWGNGWYGGNNGAIGGW